MKNETGKQKKQKEAYHNRPRNWKNEDLKKKVKVERRVLRIVEKWKQGNKRNKKKKLTIIAQGSRNQKNENLEKKSGRVEEERK